MISSRLTWGILLVSALLILIAGGGSIGAVCLFLGVILLPVGSIILNLFLSRKLQMTFIFPETGRLKKTVKGYISLANPSFFPLGRVTFLLHLKNCLTGEVHELEMKGPAGFKGTVRLPVAFESPFCGHLEASAERIYIYDLTGITKRRGNSQSESGTDILPELYRPVFSLTEIFYNDSDSVVYSAEKPGRDAGETFGIRDYQPGDDLMTIHWKMTARFRKFMVKEPSLPLEHSILLFLNNALPSGMKDSPAEYASRTLTAAFSLSDALIASGIRHSIAWADNKTDKAEILTVDSPDDSSAILKKALAVTFGRNSEAVSAALCGISGFAHLICIGRPDAGLPEIYYNVKVLYLDPSDIENGAPEI